MIAHAPAPERHPCVTCGVAPCLCDITEPTDHFEIDDGEDWWKRRREEEEADYR